MGHRLPCCNSCENTRNCDVCSQLDNYVAGLQKQLEFERKNQEKCKFTEGITIKPDGVHELDPCLYEVKEIHENVTVEILVCKNCGHVEIEWYEGGVQD